MKKILILTLCLLTTVAMLAACSDKKEKVEENVVEQLIEEAVAELPEVPEEQKDFEVEIEMDSIETALKLVGYTGEAEELVIPATLMFPEYDMDGNPVLSEYPVVTIGDAAFLGNETLKKVTVPEGVTTIKSGAFQSCSALTDVVLPESLEAIGDSAFENSALTNINIPASVKSIGKHAFSTRLNETPWYKAQAATNVIVGDGILLKYNGRGNVTYGDEIKAVAYYAFRSPGEITVKFNSDLESFDSMSVYETEGNYLINFLVPYKSNAEKLIDATPYLYSVHGIPEISGNPFKWDINSAKEMDESWYPSQVNINYAAEGAMHVTVAGGDPLVMCKDKLNIPTEFFHTMKIRMKHDISVAKTSENAYNFFMQVYYNNGNGLSEAASVKQDIEQTSAGQYIDYTIDMTGDAWKDVIKSFRIDTPNGLEGQFWIDSVEFIPDESSFDFNTLLKPVTKEIPGEDNPYKYKFEEERLATAWTMAGFEYSYAPIKVDGDNDSIHGILDASAESSITSPVINVPGVAYRKLIVRMRGEFDEKTAENKNNYKLKVYFDNGEGFSEERSMTVDVEQSCGEEKIEYTFDMYTLEGWYGNVKQIKVVLPEAMGGEFWIDKVEFVPEDKLTKADFIKMLYKGEEEPFVTGESIFFDVVVYDDYCNAVIWATQNEFVSRGANNMFYPDQKLTAAEYAEIMNKYAAMKGVETTFEATTANAPIYKMDAQDAIDAIVNPESDEEVAE